MFYARVSGQGMRLLAGDRLVTVWMFEDMAERRAVPNAPRSRLARLPKTRPVPRATSGQHEPRNPHPHRMPSSACPNLALQTDLDARQRNYVEKVHRAANNLLGIISDILDFPRSKAR